MRRFTLAAIPVLLLLLSCEPLDIRGRGYINITTQPTGCEVYLDGEKQSDTTNCVIDSVIKGDKIELRIVKGEYLDWTDTVKVSGVDTLKLDLKFTGSLKVTSNPSGASIILDGEAISQITPHTFDSLLVGTHSLRLEHEGAATLDSSIVISYGEQAEVNVNLSEHYGHIQVNSTPTGAKIWLDGSNTGYTTNHLLENVGVGSHVLTLMLEGYSDWIDTVAVSEGQTETLDASLDEATGNIQVNSTPTGADIYLDGSNTDKTTNALLEDVTVGSHTVMLVKEGYDDWEQEVMVEDDQTTTINADLGAETGKIQVNSTPTGATIYLDGSNTGKTTNALLEGITPGSHTIKLEKSGYIDWEETVTVSAGQTTTVNATLLVDIEWCYVPAGWFTMGSTGSDAEDAEAPVHDVYLNAYYISKCEVTNAQFCKFLNAYGNSYQGNECIDLDDEYCQIYESGSAYYVESNKENYPVIDVTWYGAAGFADWAGGRLPTEAEWEKAARGTDERKYPWGNTEPTSSHANYDYNVGHTTEVGSYPSGASPYGCMDMAGNVWEWCADWFHYYYYSSSPDHNPQGPSSGSTRVLRGGGWCDYARCIRCAFRYNYYPSSIHSGLGFRLVRSP